MANDIKENLTPEELAQLKDSLDVNDIIQEMRRLGQSDKQLASQVQAWKQGSKQPLTQSQDVEEEFDDKPLVDLFDDRNKPRVAAAPTAKISDEVKPKPARRGSKFGPDLIQERWATFEQAQAKALDGITDLERKRDEAQVKLKEFNDKNGDYLNQSIKQATGGDLTRIEHYKKLQDQQKSLQQGVDGFDKILEQSRDRYQRDHHQFHEDSWNRIRQQGEILKQPALVVKAEEMSRTHRDANQEFSKKLPAGEQKHTKSITAQKVQHYERLSSEVSQRAELDPELRKEIDSNRAVAQKIGEETTQRRQERHEDRLPNHKIQQHR